MGGSIGARCRAPPGEHGLDLGPDASPAATAQVVVAVPAGRIVNTKIGTMLRKDFDHGPLLRARSRCDRREAVVIDVVDVRTRGQEDHQNFQMT
jgi:hypothetical protein